MLHGWQPDGFIRAVRRAEHDDEFIVMLIGKEAAFPDDLCDRFRDHAAMAIGNGGGEWLAGDGDAPASFRHGPRGGGAFRQCHGHADGGLLAAAMRHAKSRAQRAIGLGLGWVDGDMGCRRCGKQQRANCGETPRMMGVEHVISPEVE